MNNWEALLFSFIKTEKKKNPDHPPVLMENLVKFVSSLSLSGTLQQNSFDFKINYLNFFEAKPSLGVHMLTLLAHSKDLSLNKGLLKHVNFGA